MGSKSVIGGTAAVDTTAVRLEVSTAHKINAEFWNTAGGEFLGVTALPAYGAFLSEEKLQLLGDVNGKKVLEIGCGNGRSLKYLADRGASELWGLDLSSAQLEQARECLSSHGVTAELVCSAMERECGIPKAHFDIVCSIYAIGWTTDLDRTFKQVNAYLKKGGIFVFSWSHPMHKCTAPENGRLAVVNSYFDESWYSVSAEQKELMLSNRKLSTYINALAANGFLIEKLIEETDESMFSESGTADFEKKAQMIPVSFVIKARKL